MSAEASENEVLSTRKINHDLQAQLINVKGFCGEIERSANELESLRNGEMSVLDSDVSEKLYKLINEDLLPCIQYLALSTSKLDEMILKYRTSTLKSEGK